MMESRLHKGHGRVRSGPPITQVIPGQSTGYGRASWQGGLHNRMAIALKRLKNPKNGHFTLLNTCINWDPTAFWVPPDLAHLIMGHENSPKICSKKCGFLGVLGGSKKGSKMGIFRGF